MFLPAKPTANTESSQSNYANDKCTQVALQVMTLPKATLHKSIQQ